MKIDSSVTVSVLGKKFLIKVVEEVGKVEEDRVCCCVRGLPEQENHSQVGGGDGGSVAAVVEGFSEEGSESDWSVGSQEVQVLGKQEGRQRRVRRSMIRVGKGIEVSGKNPNLLGNVLGDGMAKVNQSFVDKGEEVGESNRAIVLVLEETEGVLENVLVEGRNVEKEIAGVTRSHGLHVEANQFGEVSGLGVKSGSGPSFGQPKILRTKAGDIPLVTKDGGGDSKSYEEEGREKVGFCCSDPVGLAGSSPSHTEDGSLPLCVIHPNDPVTGKGGRCKKVIRKPNPYHPYNKFHKIHEEARKKGGPINKRKNSKKGDQKKGGVCSRESDPTQQSSEEAPLESRHNFCDREGINLEVVLSHSPNTNVNSSNSV
jgi:hypothetical protein